MTRMRYGRSKNTLASLYEFADRLGGKLTNGWDVCYFVSAFYDSLYGLSDRMYLENYEKKEVNDSNRPLSMVSMNTREGLMELSGYRRRFMEYLSFNVYSQTGMSFTDWIALPTFVLEQLLADLRHQFQTRENQQEQIRQEALERRNGGGARDFNTASIEALAAGSKYQP